MYEKQLQQLGLTHGEAKVYVALLNLGPATVGPVVKKSAVAYSNIYEILQRLIEKGLVSFVTHEKIKHFQAIEPIRIKDYLEEQQLELERKRASFLELLPNLEKLVKVVGGREEVEIFIGEKGIRTAYDMLLRGASKKERILFFYVHDPAYYERAEKFYMKSWVSLKDLDIIAEGISNVGYSKTVLAQRYPSFIKQKYVSFPLPGNIDIFRDKVLIVTWREKPVGILIQSQEIADNFRTYFEAAWKIAKE